MHSPPPKKKRKKNSDKVFQRKQNKKKSPTSHKVTRTHEQMNHVRENVTVASSTSETGRALKRKEKR